MAELAQSTLGYRQDLEHEVGMCLGEFSAARQVHWATSSCCEAPLDGVSVNQEVHCVLLEPSATMAVADNHRTVPVKAL